MGRDTEYSRRFSRRRTEPGVPVLTPEQPTPVEPPLTLAEQTLLAVQHVAAQQEAHSKRLDLLAEDVESVRSTTNGSGAASDERLTKVEAAVKWGTPWRNLVALIAFFVVGAGSVFLALRGYAESAIVETVKEAHKGDDPKIEPSVKTVDQIKRDVGGMKRGVDCLVAAQRQAVAIKEVENELDIHKQQHAELIQEWSAKKAVRRSAGDKPTKTDGHVALEARLKRLTATVAQCEDKP